MEEMVAIAVSEYERLKAAEKRLNELRQEQIDKANQEIEEIKRLSHEKRMQSFAAMPGVPPVFLRTTNLMSYGNIQDYWGSFPMYAQDGLFCRTIRL